MEKQTDLQLLNKVLNENCSESFIELKNRYEKIYYQVCSSYSKKVPKLDYQELTQEVDCCLIKAMRLYKNDRKTKLGSWIFSYSRFWILNKITRAAKELNVTDIPDLNFDLLHANNKNFHTDKNNDLKDYVFNILGQLKDKRVSLVFKLRYFTPGQPNQWKNIGKKIGLTPMGAILLHDKGKKILKKMFKNDKINDIISKS